MCPIQTQKFNSIGGWSVASKAAAAQFFIEIKKNVSNSNSKIQFDWLMICSVNSSCSTIFPQNKKMCPIQTPKFYLIGAKWSVTPKVASIQVGLSPWIDWFCTYSKSKFHLKIGSGPPFTPLVPVVEYLFSKGQTWATFFVWDIQRLAGTNFCRRAMCGGWRRTSRRSLIVGSRLATCSDVA